MLTMMDEKVDCCMCQRKITPNHQDYGFDDDADGDDNIEGNDNANVDKSDFCLCQRPVARWSSQQELV